MDLLKAIYDMGGQPGMSADSGNADVRIARLERNAPYQLRGGGLGVSKFSMLNTDGIVDGKLNLSTANAIDFQGILAPNVVDGKFTISSPSDSTATIFWDGTNSSRVPVIRRADQTTSTVPPNNLTITGLTASLKYQAFAYWAPGNACGLGWSPGDTGVPLIAFSPSASETTLNQAQWNQSLAGREPIATLAWTQPAPGGSAPAGDPVTPPPRNPGTCVRAGTHIDPLGNPRPSEIKELLHPQRDWTRILTDKGLSLECTPNHWIFSSGRGRIQASSAKAGELILTRTGEQAVVSSEQFVRDCTKIEVRMAEGHLYYANGILSHNFPKLPQS